VTGDVPPRGEGRGQHAWSSDTVSGRVRITKRIAQKTRAYMTGVSSLVVPTRTGPRLAV
jgi:hypothetical protein